MPALLIADMMTPFLLIGGGLAVVAVLVGVGMYSARKRTQALQEVAQSLGFEFLPSVGLELLKRFPRFQLLMNGRSQRISNLMSGATDATQVLIFDWIFVTGGGKHSHTHHNTVVAIQSEELDLPTLLCRPETLLDWFGLTFDGRDIDFEDSPVFSKKYHLHGRQEERVRDMFDIEVREFFERHEGMYCEAGGQWVIYYQADRALPPAEVPARFKDAFQLHLLLRGTRSERSAASDGSSTLDS
jgi:hypothetical protein